MTASIKTIIYPVKDLAQAKNLYSAWLYLHVDDVASSLQTLLDAGAQAHQEATDVGGGRLIASVKDADGNMIGLLQDPK